MLKEFPECPICGSKNGYKVSGLISKYAQCFACMSKWQLFVEKGRMVGLTLHELPKDGSAVYTITSTKTRGHPLFSTIGKRYQTDFWKNLQLAKEVSWESLSKTVSSDVSKAVFAEKEEKLLYKWEGTRLVALIRGRSRKAVYQNGILLLSTQKLRWLERRERARRWRKKKTTSLLVVYETPLEDVKGVSGGTGDSGDWNSPLPVDISLVDKKGEHRFKLYYAFLEVFNPILERAIANRKEEIEAEKKKERLHVLLDFSFLKTYMEKGGLVMKVIRCPSCNAEIEFPESGTQTKCSYCGSTIYAQDIFEKVKSLLE